MKKLIAQPILNPFQRKGLVLLIIIVLASPFWGDGRGAAQINADVVIGTWLTGSGKGKVQIYKEGNKYNGKIVWLKEPNREDGTAKLDRNNTDKALQARPIMGLNMLKGFIFENEKWVDGTIYDPENGKTYSCKITYRDGKLDVRGYMGISLIGRTDTWFKVTDIK